MAIASAKLNGYDSTAKYQSVYLEFWQVSQSIAGNTTTFGYKAYLKSNVSGASGYTGYGHHTFTGAISIAKVSNQTWSWNYTTSQLIKEGTFTKTHAADGTLANQTLTVTAGGSTALGYATVSVTLPVATIPRATTPTVNATTKDMGQAIVITVNGVATFSHNLYYSFTGITKTFITTVTAGTTSYSWTIPLATLAPKIPNSTSGTVTITAETLSGSTVIGSKTVTFTATVPASVVPTISSTTATEAVSGLAAQFGTGTFIQGKSKLNLAMSATPLQGATISSYSITANGQTFSAASGQTGFLSTAGANTIAYRVTDSRGRSTSATLNVTVLAYAPPQIHTFRVERVNASGVVDPTGDRVKATYKITVSLASLGTKNTKTYTLKYKRTDVSTWTSVVLSSTSFVPDTSYTVTSISTSYSYDFSLVVTDYFGSATVSSKVSSGFVPAHFRAGGKGIGLGMRATKDALEVGLPFYANNHLQPLAYAREVTVSTTYAYAFSSSGDRLSSAVRFSVRGTSGNVVVVAMVEIIANHSNAILISGTQGNYTPLTVKAISNGNGNFDVFLKHSVESSTPCLIEVIPVGGTVVSFTPLNASSKTVELTLTANGYSTTGVNAQLAQKETYVDSVATMKSDNSFKTNDIIVTLGYYTPNDQGGGTYQIVGDETLVDDGGSVHTLNNGLKAKLITDKEVNVKQFGAKGNNTTDDIIPIQKAVDYAKTLITKVLVSRDWGYVGAVVRVPSGRYLISNTIYLYEGIVFAGDDRNTTMITLTDIANERAITNKHVDAVAGYRMVTIKDVTFINGGIYLLTAYRSYVKNVNIYGHANMNGILTQLAVEVIIEDVFIQFCRTGIYLSGGAGDGPSTTNKIKRVWLSWCGTGMKILADGNSVDTSSIRDSIVEYSTVNGIELIGLSRAITIDTIHFEQNTGRDLSVSGENKSLAIANIFSDVTGNRIAFLAGATTTTTVANLHNVSTAVFIQSGFAGKIYCSGSTDNLGVIPTTAKVYNYPPALYSGS